MARPGYDLRLARSIPHLAMSNGDLHRTDESCSTGSLYAILTSFSLFGRTPGIEVDFSKVFHRFGPKALETPSKSLCQFFVPDQ